MEILYINTVIYFQSAHTLKYDKICMQRFCKACKSKFKKLILIDILMRNTFKIRCLRAWRFKSAYWYHFYDLSSFAGVFLCLKK